MDRNTRYLVVGAAILAFLALWLIRAPSDDRPATPPKVPERLQRVSRPSPSWASPRIDVVEDQESPESPQLEPAIPDDLPIIPMENWKSHKSQCEISEEADGLVGRFEFRVQAEDEVGHGVVDARVVGDRVVMNFPTQHGEGILILPGFARTRLKWDLSQPPDQVCGLEPVDLQPSVVWISGVVHNAISEAAGTVWIHGCGQGAYLVEEDGSFSFPVTPHIPCTLTAYRRAGTLRVWGDSVPVRPSGKEDFAIELWVPEWAPGGFGISVVAGENWIEVQDVDDDSPAFIAGIRSGDKILEMDGQSAENMTAEEFAEWAMGPEGSETEVVVLRADVEHAYVVRREILD